MVAVVFKPRRWAVSITESQSSVDPLAMPMMRRTRSESTSAPPPGIESRPAAIRRRRVSSVVRWETRSMCLISAGDSPWIQIG